MNNLNSILLLLVLMMPFAKLSARENGNKTANVNLQQQVLQQFTLSPEEARLVENTTVRFYYKVDSTGHVTEVVAQIPNKMVKEMLEKRFLAMQLPGQQNNSGGRIDIHFRLN